MNRLSSPLPLSAFALMLLAAGAQAQTRFAQAYVGATNGLNPLQLSDFQTSNGPLTSASMDMDFTGHDRNGVQQTMNFTGSSSGNSEFGRLRVRADGTLSNTYYNETNAPYYNPDGDPDPAGSPDAFGAVAYAGFTDTLQFGGQLQSGYKAKYVFFVHGIRQGRDVYTYLDADIAGNENSFTIDSTNGESGDYYSTGEYEIGGQFAQMASISFTTQFLPASFIVPDGSTVTGSGNYSSTATLAAVLLYDLNGQPVTDYTVTGTSGTTYATTLPVPEPASMAALAISGTTLLARRRRK